MPSTDSCIFLFLLLDFIDTIRDRICTTPHRMGPTFPKVSGRRTCPSKCPRRNSIPSMIVWHLFGCFGRLYSVFSAFLPLYLTINHCNHQPRVFSLSRNFLCFISRVSFLILQLLLVQLRSDAAHPRSGQRAYCHEPVQGSLL